MPLYIKIWFCMIAGLIAFGVIKDIVKLDSKVDRIERLLEKEGKGINRK